MELNPVKRLFPASVDVNNKPPLALRGLALLLALLPCLAACDKAPVTTSSQAHSGASAGDAVGNPPANSPQVEIDNLAYSEDSITLTGWQQVVDSSDYVIALVTQGNKVLTYTPTVFARPDVASASHKANSANVGFRVQIPVSTLASASYRVGIRGAAEGGRIVFSALKVQKPTAPMDPPPTPAPPPEGNITVSVDAADSSDGYTTISGWAYRLDSDRGNYEPFAIILTSSTISYFIPAYQDFRPDVAAAFKEPALDYAGFVTTFSDKTLQRDRYEISIAIRAPSGWVAKKTGKFVTL
ncbi:MAG: hypothetical protein JO295_03930 [Verrucomicrobia bacterium]|nr:hypothetical protein [Verrucomicrobiota bacterium]